MRECWKRVKVASSIDLPHEKTVKLYYRLTKPGIVYGNALSAIAGFFLASSIDKVFSLVSFIGMLLGICLIMGSGCVFNNYLDRSIDQKMNRTKKRSLITGEISPRNALIFGSILGIIGSLFLFFLTNILTLVIALVGFIFYVIIYGIAKRNTPHSTEIGAISGAIPPIVGYVAVTNQLDVMVLILFLLLSTWQMVHFYAIALFRKSDYRAAHIPLFSVVYGNQKTKKAIVFYLCFFLIITTLPTVIGKTGILYLAAILLYNSYWLYNTVASYRVLTTESWSKKVFGNSLMALLVLCVGLSIGALLP